MTDHTTLPQSVALKPLACYLKSKGIEPYAFWVSNLKAEEKHELLKQLPNSKGTFFNVETGNSYFFSYGKTELDNFIPSYSIVDLWKAIPFEMSDRIGSSVRFTFYPSTKAWVVDKLDNDCNPIIEQPFDASDLSICVPEMLLWLKNEGLLEVNHD